MKEKTRKLRGWRSHTSEGKTLPLPHKRRTFDSPQQPHVSGEEAAVGQTAPCVEPRSVIRRRCTGTHSLFGSGMAAVFQRFILPPASINTALEARRDAGTLWLAPMASPSVQPAGPFSPSSRRVFWLVPVDSPAADGSPTPAHDGRLGPGPGRCFGAYGMQLAPADMDAVVVEKSAREITT